MNSTLTCVACILLKKGIKPQNPPIHICAKGKSDYAEPQTRMMDGRKVYQVFYKSIKTTTYGSTLYKLRPQYLNGYKVKAYTELWVPHFVSMGHDSAGDNNLWLWMTEDFYLQLAFAS